VSFIFPAQRTVPPDQPYTYLSAVMQLETGLLMAIMFCAWLPGVVFISSAADMTQYCFGYSSSYANLIVRTNALPVRVVCTCCVPFSNGFDTVMYFACRLPC
jgi:hypothetical protein